MGIWHFRKVDQQIANGIRVLEVNGKIYKKYNSEILEMFYTPKPNYKKENINRSKTNGICNFDYSKCIIFIKREISIADIEFKEVYYRKQYLSEDDHTPYGGYGEEFTSEDEYNYNKENNCIYVSYPVDIGE
jgi:hypothetical protein